MRRASAWLPLLLMLVVGGVSANDDLALQEERAVRAAVEAVEQSVVRIEAVGGVTQTQGVRLGTGPTTGLIVSEDGYIISSAFNFARRPTSILVVLPDSKRVPAELVATDYSRMITLLKVESDDPLPVPEPADPAQVQVGAWAIAMGRTFAGGDVNVSVGIVSAIQRIWGKAIQTDAKVSPSNYGGPLIDIEGKVLGVLVPLSPNASGVVAGVEWYDSGIGFAVPLADVQSLLVRLAEGSDLKPGIMGVSLKGRDLYEGRPTIAAVRPNSPAYHAGFKPGDEILEIDDVRVGRQADLMSQLNRRYAGDQVTLVVKRGRRELQRSLELVDSLEPYQHAFLGVLPMRDPGQSGGVVVRYVYPDSPAAAAGIQPGDRIAQLGETEIDHRDHLLAELTAHSAGDEATLVFTRSGTPTEASVQFASQPEAIPAELPPATAEDQQPAPARPQVGSFVIKVPEFENDCLVYVPESYVPSQPSGMVVTLHAAGGFNDGELIDLWREHLDRHNLILVAPKAADPGRWQPTELPFMRKVVDEVIGTYAIDPTRIVVHGIEQGATAAYALTFANRDLFRAVAAIGGPLQTRPEENDPIYRLAFYTAHAPGGRQQALLTATVAALRKLRYPVTEVTLKQGTDLSETQMIELVRWIDTLDRI